MSLVHTFRVGSLRCHTLEAGRQWLDGGAMFGVVPKPLWSRRIPADDRNRIPLALRCLLVEHPESRASKCVEKLTRRLLGLESDNAKAPDLPGESHYDLLDVAPTASDEIVRRANRRIRQVYAQDSVVVGGLYGRSRLDRLPGTNAWPVKSGDDRPVV